SGNVGVPQYTLSGAQPFFEGDTSPQHFPAGVSAVIYHLQAAHSGTANLQLSANYEIMEGCPGNFYFQFETSSSQPFAVEISEPAPNAPVSSGSGGGCAMLPMRQSESPSIWILLATAALFISRGRLRQNS